MEKIGFVINTIINAGPVNVVYDIVKNLDRTKFEPVILALKSNVEYRSRLMDFERLGLKAHFFNFSFLQMELRTKKCAKTLDKYIKDNNIKILHLHGYHPVIISRHLSVQVKIVTTLHNICYEDFVQKKGLFVGKYMGYRFCQNLIWSDYCVSITDYMKNYYIMHSKQKNITTIYNGIASDSFSPTSKAGKNKLRIEHNIPTDAFVYIACNSLNKRKNTIAFINAANKFTDDKRKFLIVGDGPEEKKLKEAARNNKNIIFLGRQSNVVPFLQMSDIYVTTSLSEGCPLAPMEAMFCYLPIIYSDIPAHKEIFYLKRNELKPFMFRLNIENDLYETIKRTNLIENINEVSEYYKINFSASLMAKKYQEIYNQLV